MEPKFSSRLWANVRKCRLCYRQNDLNAWTHKGIIKFDDPNEDVDRLNEKLKKYRPSDVHGVFFKELSRDDDRIHLHFLLRTPRSEASLEEWLTNGFIDGRRGNQKKREEARSRFDLRDFGLIDGEGTAIRMGLFRYWTKATAEYVEQTDPLPFKTKSYFTVGDPWTISTKELLPLTDEEKARWSSRLKTRFPSLQAKLDSGEVKAEAMTCGRSLRDLTKMLEAEERRDLRREETRANLAFADEFPDIAEMMGLIECCGIDSI